MTLTNSPQDEKNFFFSLTPEKVLDAVECIGERATGRCLALNSMENRVYEAELESGRFVVGKFYRPGRWTQEQILEEHQFLADLSEAEVSVVAPLPLAGGHTLSYVPGTNIWYALFPKQAGRVLDEFQPEQLEQIGRLLARLHGIGRSREARHRIKIGIESYGKKSLEVLQSCSLLDDNYRARLTQLSELLFRIAGPWFAEVSYQRIHGDCHVGNMLYRGETFYLVDFDDMLLGPPVQDMWLLVPGRDPESLKMRERLLLGYEQMGSFDRESLRLIEPLRALRILHFSAWIAQRWEDPSFPRNFPRFGQAEYWQEQVSALSECLECMQ